MVITDNFLPKEQFTQIENLMMGSELPWYYNSTIDYYDDNIHNFFQFTHIFYIAWMPQSNYFDNLSELMSKLKVFSVQRIKANLLTRTDKQIVNQFHVDENSLSSKELSRFTTGIFYINTNNGYTEFEDGTKVESVANRMVTFPSNIKHRGTSCTDEKSRVLINFNYIQKPK